MQISRSSCRLLVRLALVVGVPGPVACAAPVTRVAETSLADLRRRAQQVAPGADAQRDRALAELTAPGGDPQAGLRALRSFGAAHQTDPRVRFVLGVLEAQHGDFDRAAEDLAATIDAGRTAHDPLASAMVESAIERLVNLRGNVRDFGSSFRPVIDGVARDAGSLGAIAVFRVLETGARWARERGLENEQSRWVRAAGCTTRWTVAGPFGPNPMLRFDETLPPETPGPLAHDYELGAARGRRPTWTVRARGCASNLGLGRSETGVFVAASDVLVPRDTDGVLLVESPNVFAVLVDGVTIATLDGRRVAVGTTATVPLSLAAGRHTLRVKVASRFSSPLLLASLLDLHGRPFATFVSATGAAHERPPVVLTDPAVVASLARAPRNDPFARYVRAEQAMARHEPVEARETLQPLTTGDHVTPLTQISWGMIALNDPFTTASVARDRARRAFESARRSDPTLYIAAVLLARLTAADDRGDEALQMLRDANHRFADNPDIESDLADKLMDRQWDAEAMELLTRAEGRLPGACWPLRMQLSIAQRHGDGTTERGIAERLARCDRLVDSVALTAVRARRWTAAREDFQRLLSADPEARGVRRALVDLLRQQGQLTEALRDGSAILGENPEDTSLREDLVDLQLALGDRAAATLLLDRELARAPAQMWELFRIRSALSQREELQAWRQNGQQVLARFNASGHSYDAAAVLVLDYTVRRQFADGSALELTHNIVRLQSQEGVDEHATFNAPAGSLILTLRTHKADGRMLEPDSIARLDAIAFPDVHIGDAIEFEYVRSLSPAEAFSGGFASERFYFRGFEIPYDHSELVVIVPRALDASVSIDPRGPAPRTVRREVGGALVEYRWLAEQSQRLVPEPHSVSAREFLPSITLGAGADWARYIDSIRDQLAELDLYDPAAADLAREIVGRATRQVDQLARLHRWVTEHIEQERNASAFLSAPVMLAARTGHRNRVLCYLLGVRGIPCRMVLVRPGNVDATRSAIADDDTFPSLVLNVTTEQGPRWVTAAERGAPPEWLPPTLAGQEGIVVAAGAPRVHLPAFDHAAHTRQITIRMTLDRDGNGRAVVTERMHGTWAVTWREMLRHIDAANLEHEFEGYVGHQVTAASLTSLRIDGRDDPSTDLVLHYTFTAPGIATPRDGGLVFDGIYPAELGPSLAALPRRTTTLYDSEPLDATLDLAVSLPPGAHVMELPRAAGGDVPGLRWTVRYDTLPDGFRVLRAIVAPPGRIPAGQYSAFSEAARAVDTADAQRIAIRF